MEYKKIRIFKDDKTLFQSQIIFINLFFKALSSKTKKHVFDRFPSQKKGCFGGRCPHIPPQKENGKNLQKSIKIN